MLGFIFESYWLTVFSIIITIFFIQLINFIMKMQKIKKIMEKLKSTLNSDKYNEKVDIENRFSSNKIEGKKYDYLILGAGPSGLSCGSILSRLGKKVLVLEQHYKVGGTIHVFEEKGFEFDTGFHYIGNQDISKRLFRLLGTKDIEWVN